MHPLGPWACHCGPTLRPPGPGRANPLHVFPVFGSSHFFDLFDCFPSCLASPLVQNGIQKLPFARRWLPVGPRIPTNDTRTTRQRTKRQNTTKRSANHKRERKDKCSRCQKRNRKRSHNCNCNRKRDRKRIRMPSRKRNRKHDRNRNRRRDATETANTTAICNLLVSTHPPTHPFDF